MKCPWCQRDVGVPYPHEGVTCVYCAGRMAYAFRAKPAMLCLAITGVAAAALFPYLGAVGFLAAVVVSLLRSVYLERWH
jgi:fructose-specific phosphotransferase system IIC component